MTDQQAIRSDVVLRLDPTAAADALRRLIAHTPRFAVRATCRLPTLGVEIALVREIVIELEASVDGHCAVTWRPTGGGAFPRLRGQLRVAEDGAAARLRFEGAYDDLAAPRGDAVDAELGFRLAQATARAMLDALAAKLGSVAYVP